MMRGAMALGKQALTLTHTGPPSLRACCQYVLLLWRVVLSKARPCKQDDKGKTDDQPIRYILPPSPTPKYS